MLYPVFFESTTNIPTALTPSFCFLLTSKPTFHVGAHSSRAAQKDNYITCRCIHKGKPVKPIVSSSPLYLTNKRVGVTTKTHNLHVFFLTVTHPDYTQ